MTWAIPFLLHRVPLQHGIVQWHQQFIVCTSNDTASKLVEASKSTVEASKSTELISNFAHRSMSFLRTDGGHDWQESQVLQSW